MKDILVSIIIPSYNTGQYIGRMLECAKSQTYNNIEIICINDGSTDNTLSIMQQYAIEDKRFIIIDIPNKGVSNARNIGIERCKGEKIFFWDSDDVVESTTVEDCINYSNKYHVNAVLYNYAGYDNRIPHKSILHGRYLNDDIRFKVMPLFLGHSFDDIHRWIDGKQSMRYGKENTALWRIMCDSKTIKDNQLKFNTELTLGEDTIFINNYFLYEQSIGYLNNCYYYLDQRENGANLSSLKNANKRISDKTKLIFAREDIDNTARKLYGLDTHKYWEGTLIFSGIEMALKMSKNKRLSFYNNFNLYLQFMNIHSVKSAYSSFLCKYNYRSIPFKIASAHKKILFIICYLIPELVIKKVFKLY